MDLRVEFLGTGTSQGVPVIGCKCPVCRSVDPKDSRLRSSVLFISPLAHVVIDTGPDFRTQMLRASNNKLDAVVYTHSHKDHTGGMDDVRSFNHLQNKDMPLYAEQQVIEDIKMAFSYAFGERKYPGIPRVEHQLISEDQTFTIIDQVWTPIRVMHHKLPILGFRVGDVAYLTDANFIPENEYKKLENLDVLIINGLQILPHISHFTLEQALSEIQRIKPKRAFITHISHHLGKHRDVQKILPKNVYLAFDGLKLFSSI